MEIESLTPHPQPTPTNPLKTNQKLLKSSLLAINFIVMVIGTTGSPLILRLYFLKGGNRKWLSSGLQTAGFPFIIPLLFFSYLNRQGQKRKLFLMSKSLFFSCTLIGLITGLVDWLYSYGLSTLPVSTSSILISTQLAFTAFFAFILVKHKFTAYSVNAVVLLIVGAILLGINSERDKPPGESKKEYFIGFFMTLGAAGLYGLVLPLVELAQMRHEMVGEKVNYTLVMEMQLVMGFFGTLLSIIGMIFNHDFTVIPREAREFGLGETRYYIVLVGCAILFQCFFLGTIGAIFYGSALLAGIVLAVLIPITQVLAVAFFNESFSSGKGVALALSLWGFASYFYGEIRAKKTKENVSGNGLILSTSPSLNDQTDLPSNEH
ncbi:hypothetical protein LUZ60_006579 [Juncus effusus]|nr:hypothetical protein LUZ60_006579 [Juncus effusus]